MAFRLHLLKKNACSGIYSTTEYTLCILIFIFRDKQISGAMTNLFNKIIWINIGGKNATLQMLFSSHAKVLVEFRHVNNEQCSVFSVQCSEAFIVILSHYCFYRHAVFRDCYLVNRSCCDNNVEFTSQRNWIVRFFSLSGRILIHIGDSQQFSTPHSMSPTAIESSQKLIISRLWCFYIIIFFCCCDFWLNKLSKI